MNTRGRSLGIIAALVGLIASLSACSLSGTPPTVLAQPTVRASSSPVSPTLVVGLVVTVLATDVGLWRQPDTRGGNVTVSFTVNGNPIQTIVYVSGEVPVLENDVVGVDGVTRWTRVRYSGHAGPQDTGTSFTVTGLSAQ